MSPAGHVTHPGTDMFAPARLRVTARVKNSRSREFALASAGQTRKAGPAHSLDLKRDLPMLRAYQCSHTTTDVLAAPVIIPDDAPVPADAIWIDLLSPTRDEELKVEALVGVEVPTEQEMVEIEPSSRLYQEPGGIFITANLVCGADSGQPISTPVSFVLTPKHLVTLRYAEPKVFGLFGAHVERTPSICPDSTTTLIGLLDAIVDRLADVIEDAGAQMESISRATFRRSKTGSQQRMTNAALQVLLARIGQAQDIVSKARDSAVSLNRAIGFLSFALKKDAKGDRERLKSLQRDLVSLTDHTSYLGNNVTFLLDAALGLINIEQNAIIKIFSVAAVIFMPPTLVASIYGMNFHHMPELSLEFGYPMAVGLMVLSAILPYTFFKSRGWL
jgi:magnesium transporter